MAILNNSNAISTTGGYDINNSLRFRSSATASLSRTPGTAGNRQKWTWSAWVKRGTLTAGALYFNGGTVGSNTYTDILDNGTALGLNNAISGTGLTISCKTAALFRDPSAWYHFVVAVDTTQATNSNGVKIYVNGVQQTLTFTAYTQNTNTQINNTVTQDIAQLNGYTSELFDGYMAEMNHIDGQQLTPSSFGETDTDTGSWKPKAYSGTYGTNGFYQKYSDIATTSGSNAGLGKDFSGNANYFNTNNISVTAGVTYDAMTDSPTLTSATVANYCVLNPLNSNATLTGANLNSSSSGTWADGSGSIGMSSGKWYFEATCTSITTTQAIAGVTKNSLSGTNGDSDTFRVAYQASGTVVCDGVTSNVTGLATYTTNDIIGVALDLTNGTVSFYKNNTFITTVTNSIISQTEWRFYVRHNSSSFSVNFGQRPFSYTPPTGFVRLNTYNLPDSTIKKGNTVMDATLYTGTGAALNVTNTAGFKPDFVWSKDRTSANSHGLYDSVRGVDKRLISNLTNAEDTSSGVSAFNSNGFSLGTAANYNTNGNSYVGWQWQAGQGTNTTNTAGTVTSTVSVNTTAGFSIVLYTGNGGAMTMGHGLGVAPKLIILKDRDIGRPWPVYHGSLATNQYLILNTTAAAATSTSYWNNTAPTSTVFSVNGLEGNVGANGEKYVAYCWAEIAGFSKFGSYVGNGSADGTFIYTGFRPKYVLIKANAVYQWLVWDSVRTTYNIKGKYFLVDTTNAEDTFDAIDFTSNGFKIRVNHPAVNTSATTYIYMAFAENPFKNANAA